MRFIRNRYEQEPAPGPDEHPRSAPHRRLAVVATGVLMLLIPVTTASAHAVRKLAAHVSLSGQTLIVTVEAARSSRCTMVMAKGQQRTTIAPITLNRHGRGAFRWTIPSSAPAGMWRFAIACKRRDGIERGSAHLLLIERESHPATPEGGGKGGAAVSCAAIATAPGGQACFSGDPFAVYQGGEDVGQCTWYAAGMRPDLDGITTGNAGEWLREAAGKKPEGTIPVVGAIAVNTTADGGIGHVAYVAGVKNGGATLILDEANLKYDARVYLNIETPASEFQGYIYGGPAGNGPGSEPAPTPPPTPEPSPTPPPTPAPAPTFAETTGSVTHTWTDYANAGGTEGPSIPSNATVQIQCKLTGFAVEDGNTWWYEVASGPWNDAFFASADAFYNNGETSGSLKGTPFVDPSVPNC
jgi:surface antigen